MKNSADQGGCYPPRPLALLFTQNISPYLKKEFRHSRPLFVFLLTKSNTKASPGFLGQRFNNLQRAVFLTSLVQNAEVLTSLVQYDIVLSKFGQQQLVMWLCVWFWPIRNEEIFKWVAMYIFTQSKTSARMSKVITVSVALKWWRLVAKWPLSSTTGSNDCFPFKMLFICS